MLIVPLSSAHPFEVRFYRLSTQDLDDRIEYNIVRLRVAFQLGFPDNQYEYQMSLSGTFIAIRIADCDVPASACCRSWNWQKDPSHAGRIFICHIGPYSYRSRIDFGALTGGTHGITFVTSQFHGYMPSEM